MRRHKAVTSPPRAERGNPDRVLKMPSFSGKQGATDTDTSSGYRMSQKANAASRKATGNHNGADRVIPNPKGCRRGTGDSLNAGKMKRNWREKLGAGFGL